MALFGFGKKDENKNDLEFTWEPRPINNKGNQTINDMSLIHAPYEDFIVTKTGNLIGMIEITGLNLELLNPQEQSYVFETFNTFLMNTLGDSSNETQQWLDTTSPVNVDDYLLSHKKRFLQETNENRRELIASYIDDLTKRNLNKEMSTKRHILIIREKISDKSLVALENKGQSLKDKIRNYISRIEDSFEQYDVQAKQLFSDEIREILKNQINFNGR